MVYALVLSIAIVVHVKHNKLSKEELLSSSLLNEVAKDWVVQPFVDAVIVTVPAVYTGSSLGCPPEHPENVMERMFYGVGTGCDCLEVELNKFGTNGSK